MAQNLTPQQEVVKVCELAQKGDLKELEKHARPRNVNLLHSGMTPMMHALLNKVGLHTKSIAVLLRISGVRTNVMSNPNDILPNERRLIDNPVGETVIHMASRLENRENAIDELRRATDFDINSRNKSGDTPLIVAARVGNYNAVKKLLKLNPNVLIAGEDGRTATARADEWKTHSAMYYDILDRECTQRGVPLVLPGNDGMKRRAELELKVESVCKHALSGKHQILRRELTDDIVNCRQFTKTPMMFAAEAPGDSGVQCLDLLIERHALRHLSDKYGWTAAHYAAKNNKSNFLTHLGDDNIDIPDKYGVTPLMVAAQNGYQSCVTTLVQMGANVNARNKQNKTAREMAVSKGHRNLNFNR